MTTMLSQIAQTIDTLNKAAEAAPALPAQAAPHVMSAMDLLMKGGIIMIPIRLLSVIAIYIFIERYVTIRRYISTDEDFMNNIHDFMLKDQIDAAITLCRRTAKPIARMIEKGISRLDEPIKEVEESIELLKRPSR